MNSLYVCYFGIDQPLVQTQVLPYLRLLAGGQGDQEAPCPIKVTLLTFETDFDGDARERFEKTRRDLSEEGIDWHCLKYHRTPSVPATAYDIFRGALFVRKLIARKHIDLIHCRVHVPGLMGVLGRKLSFQRRPNILFDIRGFFPEEYVDAGIWKKDGILFQIAKRIEGWLLRESDGFVVLTDKAREIVGRRIGSKPVEVIPCCVDLDRFNRVTKTEEIETRSEIGNEGRLTAVYIGSFGGWYLTEETVTAFRKLREIRPDSFALILTQSDRDNIKARMELSGFKPSDYKIMKVAPKDVPRYLACADIALSFIKPSYSKVASSPTKNAEYLASGLPILANSGIGDTSEQLSEDCTGVVIEDLSEDGVERGVRKIVEMVESVPDLQERCRQSAHRRFSLKELGGPAYRKIYKRIAWSAD